VPDLDITSHGAVGDGATNDGPAIQAAIDAVAAAGGGRVVVPAGRTFVAGSLTLRSHVELHVERGATLQASGRWADITVRPVTSALSGGFVHPDTPPNGAFLWARGATDVAITGGGTVDGGGRFYVAEDLGEIYRMPAERPFTVFLLDCTDVTLRDTRYVDGALWTVRLTGCERVRVCGLTIRGDMKLPNADGIDIDRCRRVRISDCDIRTPDDAISLKAVDEYAASGDCEDIVVSGCLLESRSSAVAFGADAVGPIRNVVVDGCVVRASHRGVSLKCSQAGTYENVLFSNLTIETTTYAEPWWGRGEPIHIGVFPWHDEVGAVRNVRFVNILARAENGVNIAAVEPGHIDGVLLENVRIELDKRSDEPGGLFDRRPFSGTPDLYPHPVSGFYVENAANVVVRHCEVAWASTQEYFAHALEAVAAPGLVVDGLRGEAAFPGGDAIVVR
jgi:polygalacturonase